MSILFAARLQHVLERSIASLPPADRDQRIAYCQATGEHGIRVRGDHGALRFTWGGRLLAVVDPAVFADDAYLRPLELDMVRDVPDDPRELTDE